MIGKWIMVLGGMLVVVGAVIWLAESAGFPLGHLPGDVHLRGEGWSLSVPVATCVLISIVLTVLVNVFLWFFR